MQIVTSIRGMRAFVKAVREGGDRIAFVPTMGFLHEGHISLIRRARELADKVVVSIFVNPTQFGPGEDYDVYPRDMEHDTEICGEEGVDVVFAPEEKEMYDNDWSTYVEESALSRGMCGAGRPGHFRGVTTVVAKLFNIVQPDYAVFGQKDAQQARVIERMVRDLNFDITLHIAPIVREKDGLAMSSRNARLTEEERKEAVTLYASLQLAKDLVTGGMNDAREIRDRMIKLLEEEPSIRVDYVEVVDDATLKPIEVVRGRVMVALAAHVGSTRLIDNIVL